MPTSFEVIFLGNLPIIDAVEGNQTVSQGAVNQWLGTYGSQTDPLSETAIRDFAPGSTGFSGGISNSYDLDNDNSNDTFTIDGDEKTHDATMGFNATLTYKDGTTANITAVLTQDTNGDVYLMPEITNNADAAALSAGPIASITLNSPIFGQGRPGTAFNLTADRTAINFVPCFTPGTLIATATGERQVETLRPGDRVITRDNGLQRIKWVGQRRLTGIDLTLAPQLAPIRICAGALGHDLPERDMLVSPQHRMLLTREEAEMLFGTSEVLVAAKHLTSVPGIDRVEVSHVTYVHVMFDTHQIILSDGTWSESFQPGAYALRNVGAAQRDELLALFPQLATPAGDDAFVSARPSLKRHEAAILLQKTGN